MYPIRTTNTLIMKLHKVCILGTAHPYRGGLAAYNERLAREFLAQGVDTTIHTFTLQYPSLLFPGKSQFASWEKPGGIPIIRSVSSVNPISWVKTALRIRKEAYDVVLIKYWIPFMSPCFSTIARIVRRNRKTRVICIADNIIPHEKRPGDSLLTRIFMRSIDGLVAMSESVFRDARSFRNELPMRLSPHPLFDDFGAPLSREEALSALGLDPAFRYLLFFGFIREYKGLDLLLKAFADKELRSLPLKLIVAGEFYTDPKPYLALLEELNLSDRVILHTEFIANHEVNRYFCASDLVVQPYKHATQSGVTQIGYAFSKPMLVTRVGGLAEIIPHKKAGYVVEPEPGEIAGALLDFFRNGRLEEFTRNAETEKQKYKWSTMIDAIGEVYHEIETTC